MKREKCGRCGRRSARGYATIDGVRYCYSDDVPSCFIEAGGEVPLGVMHTSVWTVRLPEGATRSTYSSSPPVRGSIAKARQPHSS